MSLKTAVTSTGGCLRSLRAKTPTLKTGLPHGKSDKTWVLNIPDKQGRLWTTQESRMASFTCCEQERKTYFKIKEFSMSSHWNEASNSMQGDAFPLIPNTSYYRVYFLLPVRCYSLQYRAQLNFLQQGCFFFYGMSFSNNSSSFNGILITYSSSCCLVIAKVLYFFLPASSYPVPNSHSFWAPHTLFTLSFFNLARQWISFSLTCIQKKSIWLRIDTLRANNIDFTFPDELQTLQTQVISKILKLLNSF